MRALRLLTVVGARPQFIKAAPMSRAIRAAGHREHVVHTGQHYDAEMSQVFFDELGIPAPDTNLGVGSGPHGQQTGLMLARIEEVMLGEKPDGVVLFGDTNSTIAGALAASKLHIPIAHVEAGLRSYNRRMPEEINRVVTDHLAALLWAPSDVAVDNLRNEGISRGVLQVGDIMADALQYAATRASASTVFDRHGLAPKRYLLATVHRAESTTADVLRRIVQAFAAVEERIVLPLHPRTRAILEQTGLALPPNVQLIAPVGHIDMVALTRSARLVLTDSGGLQKEAYWLGVPCVTMRTETEWVETVETGWNVVVGTDAERIVHAVRTHAGPAHHPPLYGDGKTAERCAASLEQLA